MVIFGFVGDVDTGSSCSLEAKIFVSTVFDFSRLCIGFDLSVHGNIDPSGAKSALIVRVNS